MGKGTNLPFSPSQNPPKYFLEHIHVDSTGKFDRPGPHRERRFAVVTDGYTGWKEVIIMQTLDQLPDRLQRLLEALQAKFPKNKIRFLHSDHGGENDNKRMAAWCLRHGIDQLWSCPHTPEQNGTAERTVRTVKDRACTVMAHVKGPGVLWVEAVQYVTWISNYLPVKGKDKTPFEAVWGRKPDVSNLRVWGLSLIHI